MHKDLREFITTLKREREIIEVKLEVDPYLELAEIHRRVIAEEGPALLFTKVKDSKFPVVTNLFGTRKRVELAIGSQPEEIVRKMVKAMDKLLPPKIPTLWQERNWLLKLTKVGTKTISRNVAPLLEVEEQNVNLKRLPILTTWHEDGGPFFTLPLVYTEHPRRTEHNLGMYRMQVQGKDQTGMHWQIHKGGGFHYYEAEMLNQSLPVTVFLGGPPALILAAIAPLPEVLPELIFTSFLMGEKLEMVKIKKYAHSLIARAEFAFCGEVPPKVRKLEGPFGDHYGYYSLAHNFPVFNIKRVYHRRDAIYPATIVGKPRQEDYYIGEYLQSLLSPIFPVVMPGVKALWTYAETGFHSLAAAIVRESYYREALAHGFRILGEGQLTLTKVLLLTDVNANLPDFAETLEEILKRFNPARDLLIINDTSMDTLDYTGRKFNMGSKAIITGVGQEIRELPRIYTGKEIPGVTGIKVYCGGCLMVCGKTFEADPDLPLKLVELGQENFNKWPLVIIVDDIKKINNQTDFLWTVFTRFDPALDIYAKSRIKHNKVLYEGPIIIDARMKPHYPKELEPKEDIVKLVNKKWKSYF
ncbi:MAG: 4-hydroxybenzoate decarboxylase subunit [Clostridia bacterium]|nr:4-hydroxybenzoate decarboxylase subunit [Clostridia bacterium]MDN5321944.1 4-hydroxybenzoate decarboxylase subunit [Clostridia bacterium]